MIGGARQDRGGAIELLGEHGPNQHVGPDHRAERQAVARPVPDARVKPVGPADQEAQVSRAIVPEPRKKGGEGWGGEGLSPLVQGTEMRPLECLSQESHAFGAGSAGSLDLVDAGGPEAQGPARPGEAAEIVLHEVALGPRAQAPDGEDANPQARAPPSRRTACASAGSHIFSSW